MSLKTHIRSSSVSAEVMFGDTNALTQSEKDRKDKNQHLETRLNIEVNEIIENLASIINTTKSQQPDIQYISVFGGDYTRYNELVANKLVGKLRELGYDPRYSAKYDTAAGTVSVVVRDPTIKKSRWSFLEK